MTREAIHKLVASVAGEISLALVRPVQDVAVVRRWIVTLRQAADALEARIGGAG